MRHDLGAKVDMASTEDLALPFLTRSMRVGDA